MTFKTAKKHLIGILGPSGGGKTSLTKFSAQYDGISVVSFADHLKEESTRRGWSGLKDAAGRAFLQTTSEDMKAEHGESVFYDVGVQKALDSSSNLIMFDDCRFLVEISNLSAHHDNFIGTVVTLHEATAEERWLKAALSIDPDDAWAKHRSETEWRSVRHCFPTFENDKSQGLAYGIERFHGFITTFTYHLENTYAYTG